MNLEIGKCYKVLDGNFFELDEEIVDGDIVTVIDFEKILTKYNGYYFYLKIFANCKIRTISFNGDSAWFENLVKGHIFEEIVIENET